MNSAVARAVTAAQRDAASAATRSAVAYRRVLPSLVVIQTEKSGHSENGGRSQGSEAGEEKTSGVGTGVVINADGAILTAHHVVDGALAIRVSFADGTEATARIISAEPENDIAVLMADRSPEVIVPAVMGSTGSLRVGDEAFAVGHPLGLAGSMSAGVISGLDRSIPVPGGRTLEGLIQFDAAVNPGNSGGPLLNRNGQVIGIVTALANPSEQGFFVGIGFAVPIGSASGAAGGPPQ